MPLRIVAFFILIDVHILICRVGRISKFLHLPLLWLRVIISVLFIVIIALTVLHLDLLQLLFILPIIFILSTLIFIIIIYLLLFILSAF